MGILQGVLTPHVCISATEGLGKVILRRDIKNGEKMIRVICAYWINFSPEKTDHIMRPVISAESQGPLGSLEGWKSDA